MAEDDQNPPPDMGWPLPTTEAPLMDRDGEPVLDERGNPVMVSVVPTHDAVLPPGAERRRGIGPDGLLGEVVTVTVD